MLNNLFKENMRLDDIEKMIDGSFSFMENLPIHIHCKDLKGKYIACNDRVIHDIGYSTRSDVLGQTDFDVQCLSEGEALSFTAIDKCVMANEKMGFYTQTVTLADKNKYIAMNHKMPLRSQSKSIIGILSYGFILNQYQSPHLDPAYPSLNLFFSTNSTLVEQLSPRQLDCLYLLVRGLSIKEIAKKISLSPRTIEHYIETVKMKLHCRTRAELIEKVLKQG